MVPMPTLQLFRPYLLSTIYSHVQWAKPKGFAFLFSKAAFSITIAAIPFIKKRI